MLHIFGTIFEIIKKTPAQKSNYPLNAYITIAHGKLLLPQFFVIHTFFNRNRIIPVVDVLKQVEFVLNFSYAGILFHIRCICVFFNMEFIDHSRGYIKEDIFENSFVCIPYTIGSNTA